ncbi:MAG: TIR domain protein [Candidatus Methanoperedens nitroreducens]|uniref:TIR domain protein n=1 Tax=Candidatus Methanoperedens nitratireducens TaxID=1392998 RepID=A0A0N8KR28_9EURY|nr:MAG: TIR domain protein [Candidatus Methanoperedens sp. BLZ1]
MTENKKRKPRIFLIYSFADRFVAQTIESRLHAGGVDFIRAQYEDVAAGDSIAVAVRQAIATSDYILVLLSPSSVESKWVQYELSAAYALELESRGIGILPVIIEDCQIPSLLAERRWIDLSSDFDANLDRLVQQIQAISDLDFSRLDGHLFTKLVADLLIELGFKIVQEADVSGGRIDITAEIERTDPFGNTRTEIWLVETKFYRKERADLSALHQLVSYVSKLPEYCKALLVTNGQLTSPARNWLVQIQSSQRSEIRVIEGPELKRLLLSHKKLIDNYFKEREQ